MKRFYNNTLMSGAFSKALRVVALLCVLLGFSSSAWGDTYYLWYNAKSNEPNYKNSNFDMSAGATLTNNKCVWTISNSRKDNSYFYISTSSTYSESNLKSVNITVNYPNNDAVVNAVGKQDYSGKVGFYVSCKTAGSTVTITIDFSSNSQYVVSPVGGGAAACTPSATITGASYDGTQITLSGSLTETCGDVTYYGWQYNTDGKTWGDVYVPGALNNAHHSQTAINSYTQTWKGFEKGKTYYFRAYAYQDGVFYSDGKILSVKIPAEGSESESCNVIEIYCKYLGAPTQFDMKVHLGNDENDNSIHQGYASCDDSGNGYAHWTFNTEKTSVCIIISNKEENYKTQKMCGLSKGNKYYFDIPASNWNTWNSGPTKTETLNCETNVLLSREAIVNKSAKTAQLFGYLKATNCERYTDYGFYYCMVNDGDAPCTPSTSCTKLAVSSTEELPRGKQFSATLNEIQDGKTYYYRAYAKSDKGTILSEEIRSFSTDPCIPQYGGLSDKYNGKPIVYTINADPAFAANDCKLHFKSLQAAIDHLKETYTKDDDFKYVTKSGDSYNLNQPVEIRVAYYDDAPDDETKAYIYEGTSNYGITAGNENPDHINLIADFNKNSLTPENTLSIKPLGSKAKPWIHHIVIRNSKNIVLDSLCIYSDISGKGDNALEIDVNSTDWGRLDIDPTISSVAPMLDANITIQNSMIGSAGFTGVHVSCYGGITFKNNDFECTYPGTEPNDIKWGASAKFLACKDVKFIQNNFRGSQATLLWVQECQNMLFMNNVFWNTNTNSNDTYQPIAAVRLVHQFNYNTNDYKNKSDIKNISCFYNTFYLAEDKKDLDHNYNFFVLSNTTDSHSSSAAFDLNSIKFQYNNCYSYDAQVSGRSDNSGAFLSLDLSEKANFCPNNFWSEYDVQNPPIDGKPSAFAFGCSGNTFTNVKTQVCETTASGPASLIVKGQVMNTGKKLTDSDISSTGIELTANELTSDRYLIGVRPKDDTWTMGAYQSKENIETKVIYWVGVSSDWDDRNNWEYETEVDGKMVRQRVSCANILSEDLKVVVEEIGTLEIAGGRKWPQVPASFTENRTNSEYDEHVSAGLGTGKTPTKFASTIELEYGAGLRGVENLNDNGTMRYDQAIVHFDAERNKWLLVGPIVRPFDTEKNDGSTRNVNSGDYFRNFEPQIYMHGTVVDGDDISWGKTFGDLNVDVKPDTVFAINASVLYGKYYDTAEDYLKYEGIKVDDKAPIPYRFTGRFAVEEYKTDDAYKYTLKDGAGKRHLINNVYPCNLDAKEIERLGYGTINVYNYNEASFASTSASQASGNVYIKAQNGFVFTPNTENPDKELKLTNDILAEGSTRTRAGEIPLPTFSLNVDNANTTKPGASNIVVRYDEFLGTSEESLLNTPKVFTRNSDTPEAYIIHNDGKYTRLDAGKEKVTIPLGVRLMKPMNLTFEKVYNEGYDEVVLVDTKTQKFYNLLKRTYTTDVLSTGDTEGRFYLNLTVSGDDDLDDEGDNPGGDDIVDDDDVSTEVEETIEEPQINIYTVDNSIVRVSSVGTVLKTIYVSDMTGRTDEYSVDGNYVELQLPVSSGVYTVTAVGETASKIGKVILK